MRPPAMALAMALAMASMGSSAPTQAAEETWIGGKVENLLNFARERHPEFAATRLEAEAAALRIEPAGALPDPIFRTELRDVTNAGRDAGANLLPARIGSAKYTLVQPLPWFGKRDLRREVAAAGADEAQGRSRATWLELATRIKLTYAQHHVHTISLRLARENIELLQRVAEIAQVRYASGLGTQQDVLRAQTELAMLQSDLAMLEGDSAQASARMRTLLGRPPASVKLYPPLQLRPMPAAATLDFVALEQRLRANNPFLAMNDARITAAEKSRDLVYRNRYPDLSLGISPIQTRNRVSEWELMLELNIPLQQQSRRAQEREAERMADAAHLRREAGANQALADLGESLAGLEAARRVEAQATHALLPQAQLALDAALAAYENGRSDFAAVLEAQRQIRRARESQVKARGDQQIRLAEIERLIGEEL